MAVKLVDITGLGTVKLVKSSRSRSIRLSVSANGIRVSLPRWLPYAAGTAFAQKNSAWLQSQLDLQPSIVLKDGQKIGKLHVLHFQTVPAASSIQAKVTPTKLLVEHYSTEPISSPAVQMRAKNAAIRALKKEASALLPSRLNNLSEQYWHTFQSVSIKQMSRRWGSCDSQGNITLNLFLMQLSWQQIDYVLCHELAHTKHMNHGAAFWKELKQMMPDAQMIAKKVRYIQPALTPVESAIAFDDDDMAY
ncbi:MAG: SprT family zinc-dependent metalloprotease [Candidatus Saccharimonadales bacterium]|jgi:predicted metal-dependent hydrolase|nr:M48 family metallopeptidase [Candidatus Saccharibacteria bacterium]